MEFYAGDPIIGYRSWTMDDNRPLLRANMVKSIWMRGIPTEAKCVPSQFRRQAQGCPLEHSSPHDLCSCGIYGWYQSNPLNIADFKTLSVAHQFNDVLVFGTFLAWGKIHFHEEGFKSQFGIPLALTDHYSLRSEVWKLRLDEISIEYGVPIIKESKLGSYSRKHGVDPKEYL